MIRGRLQEDEVVVIGVGIGRALALQRTTMRREG